MYSNRAQQARISKNETHTGGIETTGADSIGMPGVRSIAPGAHSIAPGARSIGTGE
jgi:hypothetical protein